MPTLTTEPRDLELSRVQSAVGRRSFERGRAYARQGRVVRVEWDPDGVTLTGSVVGNGGLYETQAYFAGGAAGGLEFEEGECSCPVGYDCKHVAAIVIEAANGAAATGRPAPAVTPQAELATWEQPLRAVIEVPASSVPGDPLGIELWLHERGLPGRGAWRLVARPKRPGARGNWINGSLTWRSLEYGYGAELRSDHLALARELYAAQRARQDRFLPYAHPYGPESTLDLSDSGPELWSLLDEAARIGLPLLHAGREMGEAPAYRRGEVAIDVTRGADGCREVRALLHMDGDDAGDFRPVLFLGAAGHGVVCADVSDGAELSRARLLLVRLSRAAPLGLQRMVLHEQRIAIPEPDLDRFAVEICPGLLRVGALVSSDGSFEPPEVSPPTLALRVRHGDDHVVELGWEWQYRIGEQIRRAPLGTNGASPSFRDVDAERRILAGTVLAGSALDRHGLLDGSGRPSGAEPASLTGVDAMRFTTEELSQLTELPGVTVEVEGEPPDYRDVGESLEIGFSTAEVAGERDWFDLGVTIRVDGRELPFAEVFVALAGGESHMLLDDGAHFSLEEPRLESLRQLIEEARGLVDSPPGELRISRYQAGLWSELAALGVVTEQAQAWQRRVAPLLELDDLTRHEPPATIAGKLRPYQREGFAWLASLWDLELGGILADDMGLGKTLQTLALICHARAGDGGARPFLVVVPTSVVTNWIAEAARFAPSLAVEAVTGTLAKSGRTVEELATADVVVTTYTLLRLDADAYRGLDWAGVILDEAQYVKNHQAKTYRCVRELAGDFKLALTGTPIENNLMELWSLLSIVAPGLFPDPKRFAEQYARPIERSGDGARLDRLRRRIKPLIKRRTKELVAADLPAKQEQTIEVDLRSRHRKLYDTYLQRERQKILGLLGDFDRNRFTILRSITLLRQLSLHPGLVDSSIDVPCAKLDALVEQLGDVVGGGHRALAFSQFTGFLARVRKRLEREGIGYCYLDGRTRRRDRVIERFKEGDDPVFLISLKAGGLGLNLTEADYCFLLDPWWNPATENQAIDRAHRIGQARSVMVYRLIARDTIEEKVVALARRKAALFSGVMDDGELFASGLTADDIRGLLE